MLRLRLRTRRECVFGNVVPVSEKGPVWRPRSHQDRDVFVDKRTPPGGTPQFVDEECTGKYEGEDLARMRSRRPTPERISKLESKHDELVKAFNDHRTESSAAMGRVEGKLDTAISFITEGGKTARARITTNGKVLIAIVGAAITTIGTVLVAWLS